MEREAKVKETWIGKGKKLIEQEKIRKSKPSDGSKEFAQILFMQGVAQKEIAERTGVSAQTITAWVAKENWKEKRAAKSINMDTLITKTLVKINELLEQGDFNADAFAKAVNQLKTLKVKNTVDDDINTFFEFQNFLIDKRHAEKLDGNFIKRVAQLQDQFIQIKIANR